ncbi:MAG TPA: hypothetical protein VGN16_03990 [Acidobacteriaceae bacterium]|jgi:hypothetical protein
MIRLKYALPLLLMLAAGCASLGVPVPQDFNEKSSAALTTVTGVRQTNLVLLQAHKITRDDGQNIQDQANNLRSAIDVARSIHSTQPGAADDKLTATITALEALKVYVESRK